MSDTAPHLTPTVSSRGFKHLPALGGAYGGTVRISESSAADGPHAWLRVAGDQGATEVALHLTVETLQQFAEQAAWLARHHYQMPACGDPTHAGQTCDEYDAELETDNCTAACQTEHTRRDGCALYQPCGCLTNDEGAHRGGCPVWETHEDGAGRFWVRRTATPATTTASGDDR